MSNSTKQSPPTSNTGVQQPNTLDAVPKAFEKRRRRSRSAAMKQLKVALPETLRVLLLTSAERSGRSLADEIRTRLERTYSEDTIDEPTRALLYGVEHLARLVQVQTGHEWHVHPVASDALLAAINTRFARLRGLRFPKEIPLGEPIMGQGPLVASNDPKLLGPALEAVAAKWPISERDVVQDARFAFETARELPTKVTDQELQDWLLRMLKVQRMGGIPAPFPMTDQDVQEGQERGRDTPKKEKL